MIDPMVYFSSLFACLDDLCRQGTSSTYYNNQFCEVIISIRITLNKTVFLRCKNGKIKNTLLASTVRFSQTKTLIFILTNDLGPFISVFSFFDSQLNTSLFHLFH